MLGVWGPLTLRASLSGTILQRKCLEFGDYSEGADFGTRVRKVSRVGVACSHILSEVVPICDVLGEKENFL